MPTMVRKQVYLAPAQDRRVKRRAREQGVPEAEVIRRALDLGLDRLALERGAPRSASSKHFFETVDALIAAEPVEGGRTWRRDDLYGRGQA